MSLLLWLSAVLICTIAAPIAPHETLKTFKGESPAISSPDSSLNNLYLESYHSYPGANYAVLLPKSATNTGAIGYLNGRAADFAHESTDLFFNGNLAS